MYVIGIDEDTLNEYGAFDTWSRDKMADMINLLMEDPDNAPAVIAVDVGYFGEKDAQTDQKLTDAVANAGNVVLVSTATFGSVITEHDDGSTSDKTEAVLVENPYDSLKAASSGVGYSNNQADADGIVRHALGQITYNGESIPTFAYEIYDQYQQKMGLDTASDFGNTKSSYYIRYAGKPYSYFGSVGAGSSFKKVLEKEYPVSAFKNSIVLIGAYASGTQDSYYSSIDHATPMYGVEIHANILQQLLDGAYITELFNWVKALIILLMGLITLAILLKLDIKWSIHLGVLLTVLYVLGCKLMYAKIGLILPVVMPVAIIVILILLHILVRYFTVHKEKKRIISSYGKYLSPELAATIADTGEANLELGGQKKDIAVLFVDIRSFTTLSEQLPPERVVEMLNSYLKITTSAIFHHKGTVDKFIGDATMGVFNAPLDLEDYTYRAVCAGLEMAENSKQLAETLPEDLQGRVGFGVGINCGEAIVGNIGTDFRMEYTAIGDTVNTASRLEGQAKAGNVVISQAVYERVKDRIECEDLGLVKLKGKAEEVHIYRAVRVTA